MAPKGKATKSRSGGKSKFSKKDGTKPRRVRRKCTVPDCPNRVVQGGVCVAHGAVRKICQVPGCEKAVKIAGCCSTHGPARRRCDQEGCPRVAVQGGKCLSHGARRRLCKWPGEGGCNKNAIVGGMCKRHHDMTNEGAKTLKSLKTTCLPIPSAESFEVPRESTVIATCHSVKMASDSWYGATPEQKQLALEERAVAKPTHNKMKHQRGLSLFDDIMTVDAIINSGAETQSGAGGELEKTYHEARDCQGPSGVMNVPTVLSAPNVLRSSAVSVSAVPNSVGGSTVCPVISAPVSSVAPVNVVSSAVINTLPPPLLLSTKTPQPQVTFATGPASNAAAGSVDEYFSPTLAIFEQMIEASNRIEASAAAPSQPLLKGGLKLSPRWSSSNQAPPESAVPRKVSNHNLVGETSAKFIHNQDCPASRASESVDDNLSRTVSHDVEEVLLMSPGRVTVHTQHNFPATPALCEPSPNPTIVSAGSPLTKEQLLPRPRAATQVFGHLFIP